MTKRHRRICYRERAKRQRRYLFMLLLVGILGFSLGMFALADDGIRSVTVTVSSGDTLWDLCEPYQPEKMDIRDFIAKVKYVNHLKTSELQIGQELVIPLR